MVRHELGVATLVPGGRPVGLGAFQGCLRRFKLRAVLVPRHGAHGALGKKGGKAPVIVFGQLVVRQGRLVRSLGGEQGLLHVLRVQFEQDLAGVDLVTDVDVAGDDFAGGLEGQAAFVLAPDFPGVDGGVFRCRGTDGHRADDGVFAFFAQGGEEGGVDAPRHKQDGRRCQEQ